jgi:hypothetical protein
LNSSKLTFFKCNPTKSGGDRVAISLPDLSEDSDQLEYENDEKERLAALSSVKKYGKRLTSTVSIERLNGTMLMVF